MMYNRTAQTLTATVILVGGSIIAFGQLLFSNLHGYGALGFGGSIGFLVAITLLLYWTTYMLNSMTMERLREIENIAFYGEGAFNFMWKRLREGRSFLFRTRSKLWFIALWALVAIIIAGTLWMGLLSSLGEVPAPLQTSTGDFLRFLRDNALPIVTVTLVVATYYLARQTKVMANETTKMRLAEYEPIIKTTLGWIGPLGVSLKIQNVGRGVAKDISLEFSEVPPKKTPRKWVQPLLAPHEYHRLFLENIYFKELAENFELVTIKGDCLDVLGRRHLISDTINLKEMKKSVETAPQLLEYSMDERIGEISNRLDEVGKSLGETVRLLRTGVVVKTKAEAEKENEETLRRMKEMREKVSKAAQVQSNP